MTTPVRRVVTGHDENGKAIVIFDSDAPNVAERHPGTGASHLWRTFDTPACGHETTDKPKSQATKSKP